MSPGLGDTVTTPQFVVGEEGLRVGRIFPGLPNILLDGG